MGVQIQLHTSIFLHLNWCNAKKLLLATCDFSCFSFTVLNVNVQYHTVKMSTNVTD